MNNPKQSSNLKSLRDEDKTNSKEKEPRDPVNPRGSQLRENLQTQRININE
jgi:hypothetical protein